jgi:hypothetical protein
MATLNQIAYNISTLLGKPFDQALLEQLKFQIRYFRSVLIRRDFDRNAFMTPQLIQSLGCVTMVEVDLSECPAHLTGYTLFRTETPLPEPIRMKNGNAFSYVGSIDRIRPYRQVIAEEIPYLNHAKFAKNQPSFFYQNGFIYVYNIAPEVINIQGIFEDPELAAGYFDEVGAPCYSDDSPYPITLDLVQAISQSILNSPEGRLMGAIPEEKVKIDG